MRENHCHPTKLGSILVLALAALLPRTAAGQATLGPPAVDLEQRIQQLETTVKLLQETQRPATDSQPSDGKSDKAPIAGWKDGFFLQSTDRKYVLRITGQIQADYRAFLNEADTTDVDTFLVRRARFGLEATMFDYYEFRLLPDFGQGQARIQDSYLNIHYWDAFQVEVGKFKQPVSYEELIQDRFVPTLERSLIDQITPARDPGIMVHGQKLFGDRLDYALALSNGGINGDLDTNWQSDFNGRVAVRPFNDSAIWEGLRGWQFGVSGGFGVENEPVNPAILRTPATVPWFQYNATVRADGVRTRWTPEVVYFYRGLGFATQYIRQEQELRPNATGPTYPFRTNVATDGFYVLATLLLTGEQRTTYSAAIDPLRPFNPCCPWSSPGAWEMVLRVSRLDVDDAVFRAGKVQLADPTKWSNAATELTVGFNWYFNKWVRMQFNYEHSWFDDPVQLGNGPQGRTRHQDSLLTRFQIIF